METAQELRQQAEDSHFWQEVVQLIEEVKEQKPADGFSFHLYSRIPHARSRETWERVNRLIVGDPALVVALFEISVLTEALTHTRAEVHHLIRGSIGKIFGELGIINNISKTNYRRMVVWLSHLAHRNELYRDSLSDALRSHARRTRKPMVDAIIKALAAGSGAVCEMLLEHLEGVETRHE